jgi:sortase A
MKAVVQASETTVTMLRIVSLVLVVAGLVCILYVGWSIYDQVRFQAVENQRFEAELTALPVGAAPSSDPRVSFPSTARPVPGLLTASDSRTIGRLEIPRLNLSVMIGEGVDSATLRRAAGHVPRTALPGEPGNFVVAAHRDTLFRPLRNIRIGDAIAIRTRNGTFRYVVDSVQIVAPDYLRVLEPTSQESCTLITCFPFDYVGSAPRRFVVRASRGGS